jgi:hypothetical protein
MTIVGSKDTASILLPAPYPLIPVTLTVARKALFGIFVGGFLTLSIFFLLDLLDPRYYLDEDLEVHGIKPFGTFKMNSDSISNLAANLISLKNNKADTETCLFSPAASTLDLGELINSVSRSLVHGGRTASVIRIIDSPVTLKRRSFLSHGVLNEIIYSDEVPAMIDEIKQRHEKEHAFVFIIIPLLDHTPWLEYLEAKVDHKIFVIERGDAEIKHFVSTNHNLDTLRHGVTLIG